MSELESDASLRARLQMFVGKYSDHAERICTDIGEALDEVASFYKLARFRSQGFCVPSLEDIARLQDTLYQRFVLGSTPFGEPVVCVTLKDEALGFRPMSEYRPAPKMLGSREPAPGIHPAAPNMLARWQS